MTDFGTLLPFLAEPLDVAFWQELTFRISALATSRLHGAILVPPIFDLLLATRLELKKTSPMVNQMGVRR